MVDEPCVGDHQQDHHPPRVKPSFGVEEHEQDHGLSLRGSGKRDRDSEFVDPIMQHPDEVEDDDEFDTSKKVKLEGIGLDDDSLLDDLKQTQLGLLSIYSFSLCLTFLPIVSCFLVSCSYCLLFVQYSLLFVIWSPLPPNTHLLI